MDLYWSVLEHVGVRELLGLTIDRISKVGDKKGY